MICVRYGWLVLFIIELSGLNSRVMIIEVISSWYNVKKYSFCFGMDLMWLISEVLGDMLEFFFRYCGECRGCGCVWGCVLGWCWDRVFFGLCVVLVCFGGWVFGEWCNCLKIG